MAIQKIKLKIKKSASKLKKQRGQKRLSWFNLKLLLTMGKYFTGAVFLFFFGVVSLFFYYTYDLPRPEKFAETPFIQSTKIYDRTGEILLYDIYGEEKREIVPLDQISENLKKAVLAAEDSGFYQHNGVDIRGIIRAVLTNLQLSSKSQFHGASTITQQLVRSVYLTREKTLERKVRELVLSLELERRYSKNQIFDWYLNKVPFGANTYGAEAASQTYFNKRSSELSLAESATLTALLPAPSYYSPYGPNKNLLLQRKDLVLDRMFNLGHIDQEELSKAKEEKLKFSDVLAPIKAPHFVMQVIAELEKKYGEDYLREKGLRVYTSLDWELQKHAQGVLDELDETNKQLNSHNAAVVVLNPKNGEVLAHIGSKDYFKKPYPEGCEEKGSGFCLFEPKFDVAVLGKRQPGSAFKPFVYATAFQKGYTPSTVLWDVKTEFNYNCNPDGNQEKDQYGLPCYHPRNYDERYRGAVSLRSALAQSLNLPSVKLLYLTGLNESIKTAQNAGITTLNDPSRYGLSLVLGGGEVTLMEMVQGYGVFAAEGFKVEPIRILKIEDSFGNIVEENHKEPTKVLDTQVARTINDVLSDNPSRAPIFGFNNALYFTDYQVAAKTGTTQFFNDAWTIGYSPSVVVGVWAGNNNNESTNKKSGIGLAAPIWRQIMARALEIYPKESFTEPDPPKITNPILLGYSPKEEPFYNILHYINKDDPQGPPPQNPEDESLYNHWQTGLENYLGVNRQIESNPPESEQ